MRTFIILSIACLLAATLTAQDNININTESFGAKFRNFPTMPQNPLFFYYTREVGTTPTTRHRIDAGNIEKRLGITGQYLAEENGQPLMHVRLHLGDLVVMDSEVKEHTHKSNGKTTYTYTLNVTYTLASDLQITIGRQKTQQHVLLTTRNTEYYQSQKLASRADAVRLWKNNKEVLISEFAQERAEKSLQAANNLLSSRYGFQAVIKKDNLKTMKEKKHPENDTMIGNVLVVKTLLQNMSPNDPLDEHYLQAYIEYFKNIPLRYTGSLKADQKLRYIAYYNLAKIYMYLDQPEKAIPYAEALIANGHDKKHGEGLRKDAITLEQEFNRTGLRTRHFDPVMYFKPD